MKKKIEKSKNEQESLVTTGSDGMAKDQKIDSTPAVIQAPKAISSIMEAFHVESDKVAKALIIEAATAIYGKTDWGNGRSFSKVELDGVVSLIRSIKPRDSLETLFASQIVVGHLLGMRKLAESCPDDQKIGLNLLRFSSEAMQMLIKKQMGAPTQSIVVNYSYNEQGNSLMQTMLPKEKQ